jgi:hypothetical protein
MKRTQVTDLSGILATAAGRNASPPGLARAEALLDRLDVTNGRLDRLGAAMARSAKRGRDDLGAAINDGIALVTSCAISADAVALLLVRRGVQRPVAAVLARSIVREAGGTART